MTRLYTIGEQQGWKVRNERISMRHQRSSSWEFKLNCFPPLSPDRCLHIEALLITTEVRAGARWEANRAKGQQAGKAEVNHERESQENGLGVGYESCREQTPLFPAAGTTGAFPCSERMKVFSRVDASSNLGSGVLAPPLPLRFQGKPQPLL
jgi:hypothetical protein